MTEQTTTAATATVAQPARQPWVRPAVEKNAAGQAEAGTRSSVADGGFTTS